MTNQPLPVPRPLEPRPCALVIGASSGIGAALTEHLANNGYFVAAVARRETLLAELCESINEASTEGPRALSYSHNVTNYDEVPGLFQKIAADLGGLDLVIYVAGAQPAMTAEEFNFDKDAAMTRVNLLGAMAWLDQAALRFQRAGKGHIVGISSIAAVRGRRLNPGYNATKAGFDTFLEGLRNRVGRERIIAVVEPRSNTMRLGVHADTLADSLRTADTAIVYQPDELDWDASRLAEHAANVRIEHSLEAILAWLTAHAREGDHLVLMSNGSFGGLHRRLEQALRNR